MGARAVLDGSRRVSGAAADATGRVGRAAADGPASRARLVAVCLSGMRETR
jgi:hypothetical protein